jgi:hypothetical protein
MKSSVAAHTIAGATLLESMASRAICKDDGRLGVLTPCGPKGQRVIGRFMSIGKTVRLRVGFDGVVPSVRLPTGARHKIILERPRIDLLVVDEKGERAHEVIGVAEANDVRTEIPQVRDGKTQIVLSPPVTKLRIQGKRWRWWGEPFGDRPDDVGPSKLPTDESDLVHCARIRASHHAGSAYLVPGGLDPANASADPLAALASVFAYLRKKPQAGIYIAGHACNETGDHDPDDLADRRAALVAAYLKGDRETWSKLACERHVDRDWKAVLRWLSSWGCDPGTSSTQKVDRQALDARDHFRQLYGAQTGDKLNTGAQSEADFAAYFDLYDRYVAQLLGVKVEDLAPLRQGIVWASDDVLSCGDAYNDEPDVLDEPSSAKQRGVDIWIFDTPAYLQEIAPTGIELYQPALASFEELEPVAESGTPSADPLEERDARERIVERLIAQSKQKVADKAVTRLTEAFMRRVIDSPELLAGFSEALDKAVAAVAGHKRSGDHAGRDASAVSINEESDTLLIEMERLFILDPKVSTIHLLSDDDVKQYYDFKWHRLDYPGQNTGEKAGPHESKARELHAKLGLLRPARRPNSQSTCVCTQAEYENSPKIRSILKKTTKAVPDNPTAGQKMHEAAVASFVAMRAAAKTDGIVLDILSSARSIEKAKKNAEESGNSTAVAKWSSHTMGLAMDLKLSDANSEYAEMTTRPFDNVVKMRASTVHKWMFIHGDTYGFYPFGHEPWHWEYNPIGFREIYRRDF